MADYIRGRPFKTSTAPRGVGVYKKSMLVDMRGLGVIEKSTSTVLPTTYQFVHFVVEMSSFHFLSF